MDRFSDDEALERKEDNDEELVVDSKEKEKLIENLGEIEEAMKKYRENTEEGIRQLYENVKGTGYESKAEEVRKFVKESYDAAEKQMSMKYEYAKETGDESMLEEAIVVVKTQDESIKQGMRKLCNIF